MRRSPRLALTLLTVVAGCSSTPEPTPTKPAAKPPPAHEARSGPKERKRQLAGKWELVVDQTWDRAGAPPQSPSDQLPDTAYKPVAGKGDRYVVAFSADGSTVEVRRQGGAIPLSSGSVIRGTRQGSPGATTHYRLKDGLPAAGRFVVRQHEQSFRAELTIYGSGLPIVASERGPLSPR